MAPEVISMQVLLGPEVISTSCADVMITLCGVTLRALNPWLNPSGVTSGCMAPEVISIQNGGAR